MTDNTRGRADQADNTRGRADQANNTRGRADQATPSHRDTDSTRATDSRRGNTPASGSSSDVVRTETALDDHTGQEAWLGTDDKRTQRGNMSWGAIFAGAISFIAVMLLFAVGAAALGLQDTGAVAVGIWTVIGLVVAFLVAGFIAGALGVRSGLLHGFVTWATSVLAVLLLAGWLGSSALGVLGNITGTVAQTATSAVDVTSEDAQAATEAVDPEQAQDQAQDTASQVADEAAQTAEEVAPSIAAGSWWTLAGLVIGAVLSSLAGVAGARSVVTKRKELVAGGDRV